MGCMFVLLFMCVQEHMVYTYVKDRGQPQMLQAPSILLFETGSLTDLAGRLS